MKTILVPLLLLLCGPALAVPATIAPPAITQLAANPSAAALAIGAQPASFLPSTYGAVGDAEKALGATFSVPAGTNPKLSLLGVYQIDGATVACSASTTTVITLPAGSLPANILDGTTAFNLVTKCGTGGAAASIVNLSSISGTGPYTFTTGQATVYSGTLSNSTVFIQPTLIASGQTTGTSATSHQWHLGPGSISGATLTMLPGTFNATRDLTQQNSSGLMQMYAVIDDPAGVCPEWRGRILETVGYTSTAAVTLDSSPSCDPAGGDVAIWWGPLIFPTDAAARTVANANGRAWDVDLQASGASSAPIVLPVGAYLDPFHVRLSGVTSTAQAQVSHALIAGTPDWGAIDAVATTAFNAGYGSVYLPPGANYFLENTGSAPTVDIAKVSWCNDGYLTGNLWWNTGEPSRIGATRCVPSRGQPQIRGTIDPAVNFAHSLTVTGRPLRVGMFGDSYLANGSNGLGDVGSGEAMLFDWVSTVLQKPVTTYPFAIGGTLLANLAPNSGVNVSGQGVGLPTTAQQGIAFYTNHSQKWINYGLNACLDVVFISFGNDGYNFSPGTFYDVNGYLNTAWQASCGFTPDIIWLTNGGNSPSAYTPAVEEGMFYMQDFIRTAVIAGDTLPPNVAMGSGGKVGLLDFAQVYDARRYGFNPLYPPMTRSTVMGQLGQITNGGVKFAIPQTWGRPVYDYQMLTSLQTSTSNITSSTFWNTFLGGAINVPLGNGTAGTPWLTNGQSSPAQIAFPNNMLSLSLDSSSGDIAVQGYTYRISETASCSMSSTTLTCTTAVANIGHYYSNIIIQGAGSATCPADIGGNNCLYTWIAAGGVSLNGKVITTNDAGTLASGSTNLIIYRSFLPLTVSAASAAINNGSDSSPVCTLCGMPTGIGFRVAGPWAEVGGPYTQGNTPAYQGPVVRFGGKFLPTFTAGPAGTLTPTNQFSFPSIGQVAENADDATPYTPTFGVDADAWGQAPGYLGPVGGGYVGHGTTLLMRDLFNDLLSANNVSVQNIATGVVSVVPTTGQSLTIPSNTETYVVAPAGTLAALTLTLPLAGYRTGDTLTIPVNQIITALTINGAAGQTVNGPAISALTTTAGQTFKYQLVANLTWQRVQ